MKKLLICLSAIAVLACKQEPKIDYAIVSGKIENTNAKKITINGGDLKAEIEITNGSFTDTLTIAENGFYSLVLGRERTNVYLKKGDNLNISINAKQFDESLTYTGNGAVENNYLATKSLTIEKEVGSQETFYSLDETAFKSKIESLSKINTDALNALTETSKDFLTDEAKNILFDSYVNLNNYERAHAFFSKNQEFKVSESFLPEGLKNIVFDDASAYKNSNSYKQLATNNLLDNIFENIEDSNKMTAKDLTVISDIKIPALKNDIVNYVGKSIITPASENLEGLYTFLNNNTTDETYKEDLKVNYDKAKTLTKGNPSPKFVNYENHKGGVTSLADLKGKYVYVDVWATWCGPCKAEIPSLKKIEKEYHGKNIAFVSTSVDTANAHKAWVDMVNNEELGGIQLMTDNNWKSQFVVDYGINGIPRFILIDPNGNIVSADAPRPSNPKLKDLLDSLENI